MYKSRFFIDWDTHPKSGGGAQRFSYCYLGNTERGESGTRKLVLDKGLEPLRSKSTDSESVASAKFRQSSIYMKKWRGVRDSNPEGCYTQRFSRPHDYQLSQRPTYVADRYRSVIRTLGEVNHPSYAGTPKLPCYMATPTRLELATSSVTGWRSTLLNYGAIWCSIRDSNSYIFRYQILNLARLPNSANRANE